MKLHTPYYTVAALIVCPVLLVGCSSDSTNTDVPSTQTTATISYDIVWKEFFPDQNEKDIATKPLEEVLTHINNTEVHTTSKIDAVSRLATLHVKSHQVDANTELDELVSNVKDSTVVSNTNPLFLLGQQYKGSVVSQSFPSESIQSKIGFDYYQIARDLYRGTSNQDPFIQSNLQQLLENVDLL